MLTVAEALEMILRSAQVLPPRVRPLIDALGCTLAEDVVADLDLPPFDKSLVDGYAVRAADLEGPETVLAVGEEITAGRTPTRPLGPREAAVIMTGAPLPVGADAVVMVERTRRLGPTVVLGDTVRSGQHRLERGRELRAGEIVVRRGETLNPARLALLASVGRSSVLVVPRPRVLIVPTGDELVEPDQTPGPGQIRNSNAVLLQGLVRAACADAETLPIAPDEMGQLGTLLQQGLQGDVLLITGGVSAGNLDLVPNCLEGLAVRRVFHKVSVKPGKPLWFGVGSARGDDPGALVFGLPGNPVSGLVGFLLFVRPALRVLAGRRAGAGPPDAAFPLAVPFRHVGDRPTYHPARFRDKTIEPLNWAGSADLRTVAHADGFAVFPAGDHDYEAGDVVGFLPMS